MDDSELTPLQKHISFFDRNKDVAIYPWKTFQDFGQLDVGLDYPLSQRLEEVTQEMAAADDRKLLLLMHGSFFDRNKNKNGVIYPWEIFQDFRMWR